MTLTMTRGDARTMRATATADLTGQTLEFTAKRSRNDSVGVIHKTSGDGIELDANPFIAIITLEPEDTEGLDSIALFWDLQASSGGNPVTLASGRLVVQADVTE